MTAAVLKTYAFAKPAFRKPSQPTLQKVETLLTITLLAQMVGLVLRYMI